MSKVKDLGSPGDFETKMAVTLSFFRVSRQILEYRDQIKTGKYDIQVAMSLWHPSFGFTFGFKDRMWRPFLKLKDNLNLTTES